MSWTDEEIDKLFSNNAGNMIFEYKKGYFKEIEKHLPVAKKRDFLWTGLTLLMGSIITYLMIQPLVYDGKASFMNADIQSNVKYSYDVEKQMRTFTAVVKQVSETSTIPNELQNRTIIASTTELEINPVEKREINSEQIILSKETVQPEKKSPTSFVYENKAISTLGIEQLFTEESKINLLPYSPDIDRVDRTPGFEFFIQGVAGTGHGKMLPGEKFNKVTGIGLGGEWNRKRFTASFAMNGIVSHHNGMELSRISRVYGFGSTEYKSTIEYSKLFLAESELTLGYRLGRLAAFCGVNLNYLVTTESTISSFEDDEMHIADIRKLYGYKTGIKDWGLKPMLGMSYDFKNRIQIGANIGAHVIQTIDSEYLQGTSRPLPLEGRFYVRLKL